MGHKVEFVISDLSQVEKGALRRLDAVLDDAAHILGHYLENALAFEDLQRSRGYLL